MSDNDDYHEMADRQHWAETVGPEQIPLWIAHLETMKQDLAAWIENECPGELLEQDLNSMGYLVEALDDALAEANAELVQLQYWPNDGPDEDESNGPGEDDNGPEEEDNGP